MPPPSAVLSTPSANRRSSLRVSPFMPSTRLTCSNGRRASTVPGVHAARRGRRTAARPAPRRRRGSRCGRTRARTCRTTLGVVDVAGHRDHDVGGAVVAPVEARDLARGSAPRSSSIVPAIGRPSGPLPQACPANRLCTTSSGSSSCIAISSRITSRSASTSSAAISELVTMSPSTSTASGRSSSSTRAWKQVYSLAVNALNSPPTASSAIEMSSADRSRVPLNSRCSRKCEQPCSVGLSSREPTPTQTPMLAERTPAICSVITRSPPGQDGTADPGRHPPSASRTVSRVRVLPTFWGTDTGRARDGRLTSCGSSTARPLSGAGGRLGVVRPLGLVGCVAAVLDHGDQRQLAAVVDLGDLDLDLLADRDDVLDRSTRLPPARPRSLLMCSRPSLPGSSETNAPKLVVFTTVPR